MGKLELKYELDDIFTKSPNLADVSESGSYTVLRQSIPGLYCLESVSVAKVSPYKLKLGDKWVPRVEIKHRRILSADLINRVQHLIRLYDGSLKLENDLIHLLRELPAANYQLVRNLPDGTKLKLKELLEEIL